MLASPNYCSFLVSHQSSAYLKTTLYKVSDKEYETLNETCMHIFRSKNDVNQYIFKYWQYCEQKFLPRNSSFGINLSVSEHNDKISQTILGYKNKRVCINDSNKIEIIKSKATYR